MKIKLIYPVLSLFFLFLFFPSANAQYYLTGQEPASTKWMQIKNNRFQIIFPTGYDSIAQMYARFLNISAPYIKQPYLKKVRRIPIVLHNKTTISNAMVSPAPFHADFFEMPSQKIYPEIWQKQLTLHEYRHVVQMNVMRKGFGRFLYFLLGQQGTALLFNGLPQWFYEGDAVFSETIHSKSGRGRVPDFTYPLKAQIIEKKIYPYDKGQFGSYKNFVPDHYTLGYQLVLNGLINYKNNIWKNIAYNVARKPFTLFPFSLRLHHITKMGKVKYYHHTLETLKEKWSKEITSYDSCNIISQESKFYASYLFPVPLSNGNILTEKTGINDINRFISLSQKGKETVLFTPGFDYTSSLSGNDSLIVWNEMAFDPRWSNRNYSVIKVYNSNTKKEHTLTQKSRYFAPSLSPDAKKIVAVKISESQQNYLEVLDITTGKVINTFHTPDNLLFLTPHWSVNGKFIVSIVLGNHGKSILKLNPETKEYSILLPFSFSEIKWPVLFKNKIVYSGTYEGRDNLYMLNTLSGKIYRLFQAKYGAVNPAFSKSGSVVYFSNYTANGYQLSKIDLNRKTKHLLPINPKPFIYPIQKLVTKNTFILDDSLIPQKKYSEHKYSKIGHVFNPYGWGPFVINLNNYSIKPGLSVLSQNNLSTAVTSMGYLYDFNQQTGKWHFSFNYLGWYPTINFGITTGKRHAYALSNNGFSRLIRWKETNIGLTTSIPWNLTQGKWLSGVRPSFGINARYLKIVNTSSFYFKNNRLYLLSYGLSAYRFLKRSPKDIMPRWGQQVFFNFQQTLQGKNSSEVFSAEGKFYFPGFAFHQGFSVYAGYQNQNLGDYLFSNQIAVPRGYTGLFPTNYFVIRTNYALPLAYPDWNWQGAMYLKRIYTQLFYDQIEIYRPQKRYLNSLGIELYSNWNLVSLFPAVTIGMRFSFLPIKKSTTFDFLFGISF